MQGKARWSTVPTTILWADSMGDLMTSALVNPLKVKARPTPLQVIMIVATAVPRARVVVAARHPIAATIIVIITPRPRVILIIVLHPRVVIVIALRPRVVVTVLNLHRRVTGIVVALHLRVDIIIALRQRVTIAIVNLHLHPRVTIATAALHPREVIVVIISNQMRKFYLLRMRNIMEAVVVIVLPRVIIMDAAVQVMVGVLNPRAAIIVIMLHPVVVAMIFILKLVVISVVTRVVVTRVVVDNLHMILMDPRVLVAVIMGLRGVISVVARLILMDPRVLAAVSMDP